ncbi:hypothetical protein B6V01_002875 [Methanosarcinales archaeon ex4572_44]|nr:MAG: hypothetical protein B6U67_01545 [Methanosarcinales archaeon ex4484_138]PHP45679.1 MAG: hypothetical protein B6V01_002875 [Methanosarcinales archaeon ex4572_44]
MNKMKMIIRILIVIAFAGLPASVQAQEADSGLVAEWHFDEGPKNIVNDSSGNGNDGVICGATLVKGKYGKALGFNGKNDYVDISRSSSFNSNNITVEAWISPGTYPIHTGNLNKTIIHKGDEKGGSSPFTFDLADSKIEFAVSENGSDWDRVEGRTSLNLNRWYHVAGIYRYNDRFLAVYVNGNLDNSKTSTEASLYHGLSKYWIGVRYNKGRFFSDRYFNGFIDEVRIYNRALTADEIRSHYERKQTALSLTKSASPHTIKQGQTTTITLGVENNGSTEIRDIEVVDTIPPDLVFVSGETSKRYTSLKPKDSREFQYILQLNKAGTFNLDPVTATYADEEGNYHTVKSKIAAIAVIPSSITTPTSPEISTASVHLHGEKTDMVLGEDVLLKLSAVNIIGNPTMHVQAIIIPPSGWSVTSSEFAELGAGQYTTTYDLEPGVGRDIEVRIIPNQIGDDFQVEGRIIYYFGDDSGTKEDHTLTLPITVRAEADTDQAADASESDGESTPGFAAVFAAAGLLAAMYMLSRE